MVSVKLGVIYNRGRHPYSRIHSRFNSINCHAEILTAMHTDSLTPIGDTCHVQHLKVKEQ